MSADDPTGRCAANDREMTNCPRPAEYDVAAGNRRPLPTCRQHLGRVVADTVDTHSDTVTVRYSWKPARVDA